MQGARPEGRYELHGEESDNDPVEVEARVDHEGKKGKKDDEHHEIADSTVNHDCCSAGVLRGDALVAFRELQTKELSLEQAMEFIRRHM